MVCLTDKFPLVDLFTFSEVIQEAMITEYPGLILEHQCKVDTSEENLKQYCFFDLTPPTLKHFLQENGLDEYPHEIRNSWTGRPVSLDEL
tara:strand:+ start:250 stop:519 length:270 start_codon:yes stop_codon:yes gene_type:complete